MANPSKPVLDTPCVPSNHPWPQPPCAHLLLLLGSSGCSLICSFSHQDRKKDRSHPWPHVSSSPREEANINAIINNTDVSHKHPVYYWWNLLQIFFDVGPFLMSLLNCLQEGFYSLFFWSLGMWDLSSLTRYRTPTSCTGRGSITPGPPGKSLNVIFKITSIKCQLG